MALRRLVAGLDGHWILNRNYVAYAYVWVPYLPLIQIHMYMGEISGACTVSYVAESGVHLYNPVQNYEQTQCEK